MSCAKDDAHRSLLRQPLYVSADLQGMTDDERLLIRRHGTWLSALAHKRINPTTQAQIDFVQVATGARPAATEYERVWLKYCEERRAQNDRLKELIYSRTLKFEQLIKIESTLQDLALSPEAVNELGKQIEESRRNRSLLGPNAFIVYSSTDGQD